MFSPFRWLVLDSREPSERTVKIVGVVVGVVCLLAVLFMIWVSQVQAQSGFLDKGQNAVEFYGQAGISIAGIEETYHAGMGVGYSAQGIWDFGVGISRSWFDFAYVEEDLRATTIAGGLGFHPVKQSIDMPVSLALSGAIWKDMYSGSDLTDVGMEMSGMGYGLGLSLYTKVELESAIALIPAMGVLYGWSTVVAEKDFERVEEDDESLAFDMELGIRLGGSNPLICVAASISLKEDVELYSIHLGILSLRQEPKKPAQGF